MWLSAQATPAFAWRLESGQVTTNDTATTSSFTAVTFQEPFDAIPIVAGLATNEGTDPAALRIRNVTLTGFEVAALEPTGSNGLQPGMTVDYVAIEPGVHKFPNGTEIAAGKLSTTAMQGKFVTASWSPAVSFGTTFASTASVVAAIQTMNSELMAPANMISSPFMTAATLNPTTSTIQFALDRAETSAGTVVAEDIGWIAFPSGNTGSFLDALNTPISWDARITSDTIVGLGNGCTTHTFTGTSWPDARIVGSKNRRDGVDGGWLRRCSLSGTSIGLVIDEDTGNDNERNHTTESAALLSFSDSFHANFEGKLDADKTVSTALGTYALPGNIVSYTIAAQSTGTFPIDADAVVLVDTLPPEIALRLADLDGPGSGPVFFDDGSPVSGLSYTFLGLADMTDDLEFSSDNGLSFGHTPVDDGSGTDPDVTHIRINPKGIFSGRSISGNPNFEIIFDTVIR